jgi:hypothetical protein
MKRRRFLIIAGIGGMAAAITSFKFISTSFENAAISLIKNELRFLKLDAQGVVQFVKDFSESKDTHYKLTLRGYSFVGIGSSRSGKVNQLLTAYLLSTDFFQNKMDENKTVRYIGLYNPYTRPCAHPFSHLYYPESI